jgi:hypothetical protein
MLKRLHFPLNVVLTYVRLQVAYPSGMQHLEENDGGGRRFGPITP